MPAVGGSVKTITINGREMPATADADFTIKIGGYENEVSPNGNRTSRIIKTAVAPSGGGLVVECDNNLGDHEFLQSVADGNGFVPFGITYAGGEVYQGEMIITGELSYSTQNATCSFDVMGQGVFTKQV